MSLIEAYDFITDIKGEELSARPSFLQKDAEVPVEMTRYFIWAMFFLEGEEEPYYYMRSLHLKKTEWAGLVKLGKTPIDPQQEVYSNLMAQPGVEHHFYHETEEGSCIYEVSCDDPYFKHTYDKDGATFIEGDFLNLRATWWPLALMATDKGGYFGYGVPYSYFPCSLEGTFNGKKIVKGIGQLDRVYFPITAKPVYSSKISKELHTQKSDIPYGYMIYSACCGIREDGRKELFLAHEMNQSGKGLAVYWLEGEKPIVTDKDVWFEGEWEEIPYCAEGKETYIFTDCTWSFEGHKVHCHNNWGCRRYSDHPEDEVKGYANAFGTFYYGDQPYEHKLSQTYCETQISTKEYLEKFGYTLKK